MTLLFRLILIAASLGNAAYFLVMIRGAKVKIEDTVFWFVFSFLIILLSAFPAIVSFFAGILGIQSPVNFLFLVMIFILLVRLFKLTLKVSILESDLSRMGQELAIDRADGRPDKTAESNKKDD